MTLIVPFHRFSILAAATVVNTFKATGVCIVLFAPAVLRGGNAIEAHQQSADASSPLHAVVDQYCANCHNSDEKKGELNFESIMKICLVDLLGEYARP